MKLNLIYFSAAGTTKKIIDALAQGALSVLADAEVLDFPLIKARDCAKEIGADDVTIFAVPVYAGRVPKIAAEQIAGFKSQGSRAIIVVVYGNREFDDALLELSDIVSEGGFKVIAAGAFVAEHSIFPKVAATRPDEDDLQVARDFGAKAALIMPSQESLQVPGNKPYKTPGSIPIVPKTIKSKCTVCGICTAACPVGAIGSPKPSTDSDKCIKCAHCIAVCPHGARVWGGLIYRLAEKKFVSAYSVPRKEPEVFYLEK